jgi:hypothetical protein
VLIAKLPPAQLHEAFEAAFKSTWMIGVQPEILVSAPELGLWIESNLLSTSRRLRFTGPTPDWFPMPEVVTIAPNAPAPTACSSRRALMTSAWIATATDKNRGPRGRVDRT